MNPDLGDNLFDDARKRETARKLSRRNGVATSRTSAMEVAGKLTVVRKHAYNAVIANPGKTAFELTRIAKDIDSRKIGRRLPELEKMGLITRCCDEDIRRCTITGKNAYTWTPITTE